MKYFRLKTCVFFALIAIVSACKYDDFVSDYDYCALYFAHSQIDRSVIVDEYNYVQVGVVLGGKITNNKEEWVTYRLNSDTVTSLGYTLLPEEYYSIENSIEGKDANTFYVPEGDMIGMITVTLNDRFFHDSLAVSNEYALAFELENNTSADSLLEGKTFTLVTFKYMASQEGVYYHTGTATAADTTVHYLEKTWDLTTVGVGETVLETTGLAGYTGNEYKCRIKVNDDNSIELEPIEGGLSFTDLGEGTYDPDTRTFYLKYNYIENGVEFSSVDTLIFRNREVDGINQWDI